MASRLNIAGQRFGILTAIGAGAKSDNGTHRWRCLCDCGVEILVSAGNLRAGYYKSCGCQRRAKKWAASDIDYVREWYGKKSNIDIGIALGRTARAVSLIVYARDIMPSKKARPVPTDAEFTSAVQAVAESIGVSPRKLLSPSPKHAHLRWAVWSKLREMGHTFHGIAQVSGFDHSTVHHALKARERVAVE